MTQEQFDALVAQLEDEAERNPGLYKLKLGALASLGYLYIIGVLALLFGVVIGLGYWIVADGSGSYAIAKILIPVVVLIALVLKALWVRLEAPTGFPLKAGERPRLFALIEEVRAAAKAPRAHEVLLTNELNAAIVQVPRLGLLGWQKNYLILGLPLMQLMTLEEFKAVLAHEFGHLSGAHGRFGAWIYRVRASWGRLNERLQQEEHWGSVLFVPFFGWFAPTFAAWSFVQARSQEYEADRVAAETVGAKPLTQALIRLSLKGRELDQDYWPGIYADAEKSALPCATPFTRLAGTERRGFLPNAGEHLKQALTHRTDTADTHPCLNERIQAMRQLASVPPVLEESAAEAVFGGALPFITEHFDEEWRKNVADWWTARHEHVKQGRERLTAYGSRPVDTLGDDELFSFAQLTEEFESPERAYPLYFSLARRESRPLGARYAVGRLLLGKGDERGKKLVDQIMAEHADAVIPGCEIIIPYLQDRGRTEEAHVYTERYWQARNAAAQAEETRYTLSVSDDYVAAAMSPQSIDKIRAALEKQVRVKRAYIAEKLTPEGQPPLFVVGVEPKAQVFRTDSRQADRELVQALAGTLVIPEDTLFIPLNQQNGKFKKVLSKIEGARIYG